MNTASRMESTGEGGAQFLTLPTLQQLSIEPISCRNRVLESYEGYESPILFDHELVFHDIEKCLNMLTLPSQANAGTFSNLSRGKVDLFPAPNY